ncbi:hypothetical protein COW36_02755 [bacterium (Candidatus Blackallbacteria) CG17_big_fil_post_rev_8_21_14_2_50_48_46]|uniref:Uncharacterized protein n=1 Tax=bacterium (Candidatus Blackallbacteria) CG17_big_fil_post_rev_8_21_14_2_50_48_46 TaxID=2014261 RepID=A0A2M7GA79_9BACT|nr:MAG: hypothetical protein COW64_12720 [bacterium (Candidatus Blackallbacteria) CG18_big_fil_WC_8_21_14_2_50_49_26]PIW19049.1 MAG: hypothetical protein COW36_02755 [bacterium (Candidatus Blackallbacteria) CG17_big_fil_post_rev_8_21_14_2_50_48_46]PIW44584.1 MAG: hypothetical protein COW20_23365 [bacterium (Candidatus Blackallbacteria) CG13_big_fil_rev_8_21_14_2_50_49_14]
MGSISAVHTQAQRLPGTRAKEPVQKPPSPPHQPAKEPVQNRLNPHLPAQGQANPDIPFLSEQTGSIVLNESAKTLIEEGSEASVKQTVPVLNRAVTRASSHLGRAATRRASRTLAASVPVIGAGISALGAQDDFKRAAQEKKLNHSLAATAFQASAWLNSFDASIGVWSAGAAATGAGLPIAAGLEVVGWISTGVGFALGVGGEYLSLNQD